MLSPQVYHRLKDLELNNSDISMHMIIFYLDSRKTTFFIVNEMGVYMLAVLEKTPFNLVERAFLAFFEFT